MNKVDLRRVVDLAEVELIAASFAIAELQEGLELEYL